MAHPRRVVTFLAAALALGAHAWSAPAAQRPAAAQDGLPASAYALETVRLINDERALLGLAPLAPDRRLFEASEGHTEWMVANNTFSHRGAGGSTPADRALQAGYVYTALGESLARGHVSPRQVVLGRACDRYCITACDVAGRCDGWKQSSSHWRILMGAAYRDIGAAYLAGPTSRPHWWTVMAGNSSSPTEPLGTPAPVPASATPSPAPPPSGTPAGALRTATTAPTATRTPTPVASPSRTATRTPTRTATSTATTRPTATAPSGTSGVRGRVTWLGLGPRPGVAVFVNGAQRAVTDAGGGFQVTGLPSGRHALEARAPGALTSRGAFEVLAGVVKDAGSTALVPGDVYASQSVDLLDLLMVAAALGRCRGAPLFDPVMDLDGDGCVDDDDYLIVLAHLGRVGPTAWTANP